MLDSRASLSTQSTLNLPPPHSLSPLQKPHGWHWASSHSSLRARDVSDHRVAAGPYVEEGHITQWLDDTRSALSRHAPYTPPPEMDAVSVNTMLIPRYGGLANMSMGVKPAPALYQANGGFYGDKSLAQALNQPCNKPSMGPSSPERWNERECSGYNSKRRGSDEPIASYLQIPKSINDSKGSLSEFAAQITCLFWFGSSFTLHRVEEGRYGPTPESPLALEALPNMGFRKWVTTILSTTQVTQNVILLALMFIYRLKKLNPTVKGKPGSEFRLLTVALMLGNKFLDDNTYTNKTWAEVSGISVQEIHIMEVEFLSNMKYTLYVSELEWAAWHQKLGRFWDYFDKASSGTLSRGPGALLNMPPNLPSPPASIQASPPFQSSNGPSHVHPLSMPPYLAPSIPSPAARMPDVDLRPSSRKRSYDDPTYDLPSKRPAVAYTSAAGPSASLISASPSREFAANRLPVPRLSVTTGGSSSGFFSGSYSAHLPPPSTRAPTTWSQSQGHQNWSHQNSRNPSPLTIPTPASVPSLPPMHPSQQQPLSHNGTTTHHNSRDPSPTNGSFASQNSSQDLLSPSGYPTQRSSPYRPVRGVSTLLVPPPSASLHLPAQQVGSKNMHYQPIGRPASERKTGVVPYLHHQDGWLANAQTMPPWPTLPQPQQSHASY